MVRDRGGVEAKRFGARTSGEVLLYSAVGRLLFFGGITGSRGHEGDNYGLTSLASFLTATPSESAVTAGSPVFGCALGLETSQAGRSE
jgi:hypothetical protein